MGLLNRIYPELRKKDGRAGRDGDGDGILNEGKDDEGDVDGTAAAAVGAATGAVIGRKVGYASSVKEAGKTIAPKLTEAKAMADTAHGVHAQADRVEARARAKPHSSITRTDDLKMARNMRVAANEMSANARTARIAAVKIGKGIVRGGAMAGLLAGGTIGAIGAFGGLSAVKAAVNAFSGESEAEKKRKREVAAREKDGLNRPVKPGEFDFMKADIADELLKGWIGIRMFDDDDDGNGGKRGGGDTRTDGQDGRAGRDADSDTLYNEAEGDATRQDGRSGIGRAAAATVGAAGVVGAALAGRKIGGSLAQAQTQANLADKPARLAGRQYATARFQPNSAARGIEHISDARTDVQRYVAHRTVAGMRVNRYSERAGRRALYAGVKRGGKLGALVGMLGLGAGMAWMNGSK